MGRGGDEGNGGSGDGGDLGGVDMMIDRINWDRGGQMRVRRGLMSPCDNRMMSKNAKYLQEVLTTLITCNSARSFRVTRGGGRFVLKPPHFQYEWSKNYGM